MSALTFEDLCFAAGACRDAARADMRTLELMRGYCTDDTLQWYEVQIRLAQEREERFKQAIQVQWARENGRG